MSQRHELVDISAELRHETEKAYLFYDGTKEFWVPKSIAEWEPPERPRGTGTVTLPYWFADKEELI